MCTLRAHRNVHMRSKLRRWCVGPERARIVVIILNPSSAEEKAPLGESDGLIYSRWTQGGQGTGDRPDVGHMPVSGRHVSGRHAGRRAGLHVSGRQVWEPAVGRHVGIHYAGEQGAASAKKSAAKKLFER